MAKSPIIGFSWLNLIMHTIPNHTSLNIKTPCNYLIKRGSDVLLSSLMDSNVSLN